MKYVVVSGGVVSGLGKGVTASSLGVLLKAAGWRVTSIKIDPYINLDAGTMSPFEHGETYVLDDGGESDLDLGNYERFVDSTLTRDHNITTGKVYQVRARVRDARDARAVEGGDGRRTRTRGRVFEISELLSATRKTTTTTMRRDVRTDECVRG